MATNTNQTQQIVFWMQQAYELSQQRLSFRQRYFIVATTRHNRNQLNIHGNKHKSIATLNQYYRNAQLVVAIGTQKGNHLVHCGINTNLLQRMF